MTRTAFAKIMLVKSPDPSLSCLLSYSDLVYVKFKSLRDKLTEER